MFVVDTKQFDSENEMVQHFLQLKEDKVILGLVFHTNESAIVPKKLSYDIRIYNKDVFWNTNNLFETTTKYSAGKGAEVYLENGFLSVQLAVGLAYAKMLNVTLPEIEFQELPYPPHWEDELVLNIHMYLLPLTTICGFVLVFPGLLDDLATEERCKFSVSTDNVSDCNTIIVFRCYSF